MEIHLNYFIQPFKCVKAFLVCFIISGLLFPAYGSNHYVDKDANGSNNGTSWSNAWESLSGINWSSIQPGDIIYVSGGTTGKTYNSTLEVNASGSAGSPIIITRGIDAGHNGEVILESSGSEDGIKIWNESYVTVSNFTVNDWYIGVYIGGNYANATHDIIIDNCDGRMSGRFIKVEGNPDVTGSYCHDITIRNCDVYTPASTGHQNDFIYAQYMAGLIVENNSVDIASNDSGEHNDCLQTYYVNGPVTVRDNYFEHSDTKTSNSQGIFFENYSGDFFVYNNMRH